MDYNTRAIMARAWQIKREDKDNIFGLCLKMAWAEAKGQRIDPEEYNPISAYYKDGRASVEQALNTLDIDGLKEVIKRRGMDGTGRTRKWKTKEKLVNFILDMSESRALQGDVFRNYKR